MIFYISFGYNCHAAQNLKNLNLRNIALPFDWLLTNPLYGIEYVNKNILDNFKDQVSNLSYNNRGKVISNNFIYTEFFHHDLIKNTQDRETNDNNTILIDTFIKRGKRFMEIINNVENDCIFLYNLQKENYNNKEMLKKILNDLIEFTNIMKNRCKYKLIIYVFSKDDFNFIINNEIKNLKLKNVFFKKYINGHTTYGNCNNFLKMINECTI